MRLSHVCARGMVAIGLALGTGLAAAAMSSADPIEPAPVFPATDAADAAPMPGPGAGDANTAATTACSAFSDALDGAAAYYGDFADSIEGTAQPDYSDPIVNTTNTSGRTALREAAGTAMSAAGTPGLQPDIAGPMRSWALDATKLLVKMGLHGGGQSLNTTATEMNEDASATQMACAAAGTHA